MSHQQYEFDEKCCKFIGKSSHDCYKLIWQWSKEKSISLSLFEALCEAVALRIRKPTEQQPTPQGQTGTTGKPQIGECTTSAIA